MQLMIGSRLWAKQIFRVGIVLFLLGLGAQSGIDEPFGLPTVAMPANDRWWATWKRLQSEIESEKPIIARCRSEPDSCGSSAALRFIAIVNHGAPYEGVMRIKQINRAVNLTLRTKEQAVWTSPLTTLAAGEGDCKQHAVLKYAALADVGFALDDLRLVVGSTSPAAGHAVLTVRSAGRWFVLDNRSLDVVGTDTFADFQPLVAFDHRGVRQFVRSLMSELSGSPCDGGAG